MNVRQLQLIAVGLMVGIVIFTVFTVMGGR